LTSSTTAQAIWFPDAVDARNRAVRLCLTPRSGLADTAFLDDRWDRSGCQTRTVPLGQLPQPDAPAAPVFIWHTAFCCSTLLARCLDRPGTALSLKEPAALMEIANIKRRQGQAVSDAWLKPVVTALCQPVAGEHHAVIKPTNTVNNLIGDVARLFPDSRHLFLTSQLRAFLISIAKKGEAGRAFARRLFTIFAMDGHPVARTDPRQLMQMSDLQIAALVWQMQVAAMLEAAAQGQGQGVGPAARFASMDGDAFVADPAKGLAAADAFFGLELGADHVKETAEGPLFTRDAKDTGQAHGPDRRRQEAERIAGQLGPELDAIVDWSYGLFPQSPRDGRLPNALV
jgi:hypothetical protein